MRGGWEEKRLQDIAIEFGRGKSKHRPRNDEKLFGGKYPFIQTGDVRNSEKYITQYSKTYNELGLSQSKLWDKGTICITIAANIAETAILDFDACFPDSIIGLNVNPEKADNDYTFYALQFLKEELQAKGKGSAQDNINLGTFTKQYFPFPTLVKQKEIVAILDEVFEGIEKARANLKKNIENTKELFHSNLNEIFSQTGDDWNEEKLVNITTKIGSGATPRGGQKAYKESGISLIRSLNVYDEGFRSEKLAFIDDQQAEKLNNVIIEENDVLLNITGASVARCCIAPKDFLPARVNQHVSIIRPMQDRLNSKYLHYQLISKVNKDKLLGIGEQGATRQAITKAQIQNFSVAFPNSIDQQKEVVAKLRVLESKSNELISLLTRKINNLDELKKSILQKAFTGELTSKDIPA